MPDALPAPSDVVELLGIEASRLLGERRGIGRYVRNVVRELAGQRPALRFTLFVDDVSERDALLQQFRGLHPSLPDRTQVMPSRALGAADAQVMWYPWNLITEPATRAAMVVTTHDLAPMLAHGRRWHKLLRRAVIRRRYRRTMQLAHQVLTDSAYVRDEIVATFGVEPSRLNVVLLASDDLPMHLPDDASPLEAAGVRMPFFLTVGGHDERKNLASVYAAMAVLWAQGMRVPLVQCGPGLPPASRRRLRHAAWLHHVGYVSDQQLATLYRRTTALLFPSRYEGFGLPVAEAMRVGAPVISSNGSSLPEVAGDAALLVAWDDVPTLVQHMRRLIEEPRLGDELRARGRQQAERFRWSATAAATYRVFEKAWRQFNGETNAAAGMSALAAASLGVGR